MLDPRSERRVATVPNLITLSRLIAVAVLVVLAVTDHPKLYLWVLGYAMLSDVADGPLARILHQESPFGARLDSAADTALYLTIPPTACIVFPYVWTLASKTLVMGYLAYVVPLTYGLVKYGRLTAYHAVSGRLAAVMLSVSFLILIATRVRWPLDVSVVILWASAFEEMAITRTLPTWRADVRSIWQARRLVAASGASQSRSTGTPA